MASLEGKVIIITGAGSGFGAQTTKLAAERGAKVVATDINETALKSTLADIKSKTVLPIIADVTKLADWERVTKETVEKFGEINVLVNNAGWSYVNKNTLTVTEDEFDRVFLINVKSIYFSVQTVIAQLVKQGKGGSVINIGSVAASRPRPGLTWYSATKGAVTVATKALASDFAPQQIRVNSIAPVLTGTGLFSSFTGLPHTEENVKKFLGNIPLGRLGSPKDVAEAVLFYASDSSVFLTGTDLPVDGGRAI